MTVKLDLTIGFAKSICESRNSEVRRLVESVEGNRITEPDRFSPKHEYLLQHNEVFYERQESP